MPRENAKDDGDVDQWKESPDEDCPECGARDWTPLWYGFGGVEDYRGVKCGGCHADVIRSDDGSTDVRAVSDSEVIPHGG